MHSFAIQHCAANLMESTYASQYLATAREALSSMHATHALAVPQDSSHGTVQGHVGAATPPLGVDTLTHDKRVSIMQEAAFAVASVLYILCASLSSSPQRVVPRAEHLGGMHIDPYETLRAEVSK